MNTIEHALMEIDTIIYNKTINEDILSRKKTFLKAYEFISGEIRPKQTVQFIRSTSKFKKPKLPHFCNGYTLVVVPYFLFADIHIVGKVIQ